ncbi:MAG: polymorphic toxin type 23 domain-containing protein [Vicingaceae bacterium]
MLKVWLLILASCYFFFVHAQFDNGGKIGIDISLGTHIQRIGLMIGLYGYNNFMEVNSALHVHYNFRNLGPRGQHMEAIGILGIQGHWGRARRKKFFFNEYSNMSPFLNSSGYTFYLFLSGNKTSQTAGAIHVNIDAFQFSLFNDALGLNQIDDKYRTGGFSFSYQVDSMLLGLNNTLWTGKSVDAPKVKDPDYPSRDGYRDPIEATYGHYSHGILSLRLDALGSYQQVVRAGAGVDHERIRHLLQNKLMHDGLLPLIVTSENPHYPMIQNDETPYLFKEGQSIKKVKPYLQLSANQPAYY